jgi:opacity protein-like surface antigen
MSTMTKRLLLLLALLTISSSVFAQRFNRQPEYAGLRDNQWEASLMIFSQSSVSNSFEDGSAVDVDSQLGWGISFGWNWTPKWQFSGKFAMVEPDYAATIVPEDPEMPPQNISYKLSRYLTQLNTTYHFFRGPLTPYIQAGIGWTRIDSNIPSSPPVGGCWWDPWWGYICSTTWSTYDTSEFTYNVGLGLRWDVNGALFFRGAWNREFVSVDRGSLDFDMITLEAGLMW